MAMRGQMIGASIGMNHGAKIAEEMPAQNHARTLSDLASELYDLRVRLGAFLSRMNGPRPPEANPVAQEQPAPLGVLHVAMFEAQRIRNEISELHQLVSELEQIA